MAERTGGLMGDDQMRKEMAVNAIEKSRGYSIYEADADIGCPVKFKEPAAALASICSNARTCI